MVASLLVAVLPFVEGGNLIKNKCDTYGPGNVCTACEDNGRADTFVSGCDKADSGSSSTACRSWCGATFTACRAGCSKYHSLHSQCTVLGRYGDGSEDTLSQCNDCGQGYWSSTVGAFQSDCRACDGGKFSSSARAVSINTCEDCSKGKYGPSSTTPRTSDSECTNCAHGRYGDTAGYSLSMQCKKCRYFIFRSIV